MTTAAARAFVFGLAYIPVTAWLWLRFFRQCWPSAWRVALGDEVAAWAWFCCHCGLGALAAALVTRRPAAAAGLAVMVTVMFLLWLRRRRRRRRAARAAGARARARLAAMLARFRAAGPPCPQGGPA